MEEHILEEIQNESESTKAVDPPKTQDQDYKEILDQEEEEGVAIPVTNDKDEESVEDRK